MINLERCERGVCKYISCLKVKMQLWGSFKKIVKLRFKHMPVNEVFQNCIHLIWLQLLFDSSEK